MRYPSNAMPCTRAVWLCAVIVGCGDAGELSPFASGPEQAGSGGGTAEGGDASGSADESAGEEVPWDGQLRIAYVRCVHTTALVELSLEIEKDGALEQSSRTMGYADVYDRLPNGLAMGGGWVAPCDLVLRQADGSEEVIYDCTSRSSEDDTCAALDPAVSHDGGRIAFSVFRGAITHQEMRASPTLIDPEATGGEERFFALPNPRLETTEAALHIYDVERGELTELPHEPGVFDAAPAFLSTDRIAFVSTRAQQSSTRVRDVNVDWQPRVLASVVGQLHTMDATGRDVVRIAPHTMNGDAYPFQLVDGRIAHGSWQAFGMLPFRYDNGSVGSPGATHSLHLYAVGPWGTHLSPLFGQHTHISDAPTFEHLAVHRMTQGTDGRVWTSDAGGIAGGRIYGFAPPPADQEGPAPAEVERFGDVFRPTDVLALASWAGSGSGMAGPTPAPDVLVNGYDDPLALRGFLRDPAALPGNALMVGWAKGGCAEVGSRFEEVFGDTEPPWTSGSDAFIAMNVMEYIGTDTPGCDAGIYRVATVPVEHPSALELVVDTREFHEIMPVAVVPYEAVHGVVAPEAPIPEVADGVAGAPFGEIAVSSMLLRETRSGDGHPFGGLLQWTRQGTDTSDYTDEDVCGMRVLAVQPNGEDETGLRAPAGHRLVVLGEVPVRHDGLVDPLGMPDTSVRVRVPADTPVLLQTVDCEGRSLNTSQTPMSVRPGERLSCGGCHQRSSEGLAFDDVAAAAADYVAPTLGEGVVPLLADEGATVSVDGWGVEYEYERDVVPIFEARCVSCHAGADPAAGLPLDAGGFDPGSTWWRLIVDTSQSFVPADRLAPAPDGFDGESLRTPQLTRYVRFMSARGSLLYWKAANARMDGRTDEQFADDAENGFADVDFGEDHPTEITAEELAVLGRWIDTGGGAGAKLRGDVIAPTLSVAVEDEGDMLRVGTVDVGSGIDAASLSVCRVGEAGACTEIAAPAAAEAGTVDVALPEIDDAVELRIAVSDRAGNRTELLRTVEALRGVFGQGAPAGEDGEDASSSEGTSASDEAEMHDAGCGCTAVPRSGTGAWLLLFALAPSRRRRSR